MNTLSQADRISLKQRLAGLRAGQRARLIGRLGQDQPQRAAASGPPAAIPRARPLRVEEHPRVAVFPASPGQQRMWFLHHYAPASPVYCVPCAFHLAGPLNVAWLEAAFGAVIGRHDMLRTAFAMEEGELFQRVAASSAFCLQQINLEEISPDTRKAVVERRLEVEACRAFDLAAGPPFRALLVRWRPAEHVLLLVWHHIISDGWSRSNFYRELSEAYEALAASRPVPLRELPVQFADYSAWQQDRLAGGALAAPSAYWKMKLSGEPEPLDLPSDRARPAAGSFRGGRCSRGLDPALRAALQLRAQEEGATFFMILLAAFKTLLHRYTGHDDLMVGVPIANRPRVEVEGLIGYFANTLVMRTTLPGDPTFRELLRRVKETAVEAYAHQDMPFERLVELLPVRRDPSRPPLFQTSFALEDFPAVTFKLPGIQTAPWPVTTHTSKFDFSLTVENSAQGWTATVEYSTDLFDAGRVEGMLEHWRMMLDGIAANPDQHLSELPMLTAAERHQLLVEWNQTRRCHRPDRCLHQLFQEQVERTPGAVAVVFEKSSLTYRELNNRANRLAHHLRSLGVGPDALVAICVERSLETIIGLIGILKAGGAYVPIDPHLPRSRLALIMADAAPAVLLTQRSLSPLIGAFAGARVWLDEWEPGQDADAPVANISPTHAAYVIYTSGSTGRPKGVVIEHRSVVNFLHAMRTRPGISQRDVLLAVTPISFDISGFELFLPLTVGARLVVVPEETRADGVGLMALLKESQTTMFVGTPATWRILLQAGWAGSRTLRGFIGGEAFPPDLAQAIRARCAELWNLYGPTETCIFSTAARIESPERITIGTPIANTSVYVVCPKSQPVPVGVPGELLIGGVGLARGYLNQPVKTSERFIPDGFSAVPGARLYRTGDRVRWLPEGNLEFLGRLDSQVKIRGFRIELGEIESVLGAHPALTSSAVLSQPDQVNGMGLSAFIVLKNAAPLSLESLRAWLGEKLPDYMIPSRFVPVRELPLSPNGKLDRKALEKLHGAQLGSGTDYVAPRNEMERQLAALWQVVLRRERIGVHDNFFNLGGHSLLAVVICSQIGRRFNLEVPLRQIFRHPTIERLARQVETLVGHVQSAGNIIARTDRPQLLPMSFAQQGMWLLQQTLPDAATYNQAMAWRLSGRVDRQKVRRALKVIMERHEVLRTALVQQDGNLMQQIVAAPEISLPCQEVDLEAVPPGQQPAALEEQLRAEARRPFNLTQAPLWRVMWLELGGQEQVLALTFHHSIMDEWSIRVLCDELERLYATDGHTEPAQLPELPVQYADYALWQRRRLTGNFLATQQAYWNVQLQDLPPALELPANLVRPLHPSGRGATHHFQLSGSLVAKFRELAREENTTLFTVLLAAFQVWLHRYTGQQDIVVGTPVTGRERPEFQSLFGFFLNTLPIRVRLEGSQSFRELVRLVRETLLDGFSHAALPFEQMVELAVKERQAGQPPLYQVMFVLLETGLAALRLDKAQDRRVPMSTGTSKSDLTLSIQATDQACDCQLEYATDLFDAASATRMAGHLTELLGSIAEDPQQPISRLRLMSAAERHQVLVEWNQTQRDYPRGRCVDQLFAEQVERTPDAVAVVFVESSLTYRELNDRANQLAHHLRSLGVEPGELVGLRVERSLEMIIALLGILKAGAAYWGLEENLPQDRLRLMLADAKPRLLLVGRESVQLLSNLLGKGPADLSTGTINVAAIEDLLASPPGEITSAVAPHQASDPAYVSYTSGSTGQPRGVLVSHRGVVRLVKNTNFVSLNAAETLLHMSPLSFDASTFELWGALLNGGRVILLPPGQPLLADIGKAIRRHGVTTLWLTAGLFHLMVDECLDDLKPLRQLLAGGDVLSPEHVRKARRSLQDCRIINGYGPTENTTFTCCYAVADGRELTPSVPIGRPIANTQVYVLDSHRQPVAIGVAGELYAGGDGLACGYLHEPQLTADRFVPDPVSGKTDARLYRTGDLVRWRSDGNLEFLGRLDSQVKIRGFRIELGEVQTVLRAQPEVREVVVVVREDLPGDKRLVAYLAAKTGEQPDALTMRTRLAEKLPDYMIPDSFAWLDQLPLTTSGKVDRKALPVPQTSGGGKPSEASQPINLLELELIRIWRRIFRREDIGRRGNFFALGGHSLLAARLAAEIDKLVGCKLPIASLFQSPTIELLAQRLADENWAPPWISLVPLQPMGSKPPLFFVHGWGGDVYCYLELAKLLGPDQPTYGIQAVGLDGKSARHITIEEMAAHYVEEIISFQADGPFYLAGFSMGGLIAFEIARQLHRRGRAVALLALLDSTPVGSLPWAVYGRITLRFFRDRILFRLRRWLEMPNRDRISSLRRRWIRRGWANVKHRISRNRAKPPPVTSRPKKAIQPPQVPGFGDYYHAIASAYRPRRYRGAVDVFFSNEADLDRMGSWRYLARGGVSFHRVPGGHLQFFMSEGHRPALANSLATLLHRAQEKVRANPSRGG